MTKDPINLSYRVANTTNAKVTHDAATFKLKLAHNNIGYEASCKPDDLNTKEFAFSSKLSGKAKPEDGLWDANLGIKAGLREMGLFATVSAASFARAFFNFPQTDVLLKSTGEKLAKASANIHVDDFNLGLKTEYNVQDKKLSSLWTQATYHHKDIDAFVRANVQNHRVTLGFMNECCSEYTVAADVTVDPKKELKGFQGQPATARLALKWEPNKTNDLTTNIEFGEDITAHGLWKNKFNDNWTLSACDRVNITNFFKNPEKTGYSFGLRADYKF